VLAGAHILRVHDLQAAREAVAVADGVLAAGE
jgi:dihydropteroate synthase